MDPITASALWGLVNLWRIVRLVWTVTGEKRAARERREAIRRMAQREQLRPEAPVVARGRGWTMREVDDA